MGRIKSDSKLSTGISWAVLYKKKSLSHLYVAALTWIEFLLNAIWFHAGLLGCDGCSILHRKECFAFLRSPCTESHSSAARYGVKIFRNALVK